MMSFNTSMKIRHIEGLLYEEEKRVFFNEIKDMSKTQLETKLQELKNINAGQPIEEPRP